MLSWHLQQGRQVIRKSVTPSRIAENFDVFDFRAHRRPGGRLALHSLIGAGTLLEIAGLDGPGPEGPSPAD